MKFNIENLLRKIKKMEFTFFFIVVESGLRRSKKSALKKSGTD